MNTELIFLAAGQSRRFGGIKQLADIHGQPMICHCLSAYRQDAKWLAGIRNGWVVLGANASVITKALPADIQQHLVETWQIGMGHSLAQSMQLIANDTTHVLVGLADQVLITQVMIEQMLALSHKHPQHIIAAKYSARTAVPAIFPKEYFTQLSLLSGDMGAKELLQQNQQQIISFDMPEAAFDIDTTADLKLI